MSRKTYTFPVPMQAEDLEAGLRLTRIACWNQLRADWETFLDIGRLRCVQLPSGGIVGTIGLLPLGTHISWISLVLVSPDHRGGGLASRMIQWAVELAEEEGWTAMLDATDAGARVYRKLGFQECEKLFRCVVMPEGRFDPRKVPATLESVDRSNVQELADWDRAQSGLDRSVLMNYWIEKGIACGRLSRDDSSAITGYSFSRKGYRYPQVGPIFAATTAEAVDHLVAGLQEAGGPVLMDLTKHGLERLRQSGSCRIEVERGFIRMRNGIAGPEIPSAQYTIAGPEFG